MGLYDDMEPQGAVAAGGMFDDLEKPGSKEKDGAFVRGWNKAKGSMAVTANLTAQDSAGAADAIAEADAYSKANPGMKEGTELMEAWDRGDGISGGVGAVVDEFGNDWNEARGLGDKLTSVGKNAQAMGEGVLEQTANMVAPMAGMGAGFLGGAELGGAVGSLAGPGGTAVGATVGGIGGAWLGASAGNTAIEGGYMAQDALHKAGIDPQDRAAVEAFFDQQGNEILKTAAIKGGIIGAVDTATMGVGGKLLNAPARAAADRALTAMGVDLADNAAVKAAKASPDFAALVGNDAAFAASKTGAGNIARNTTAAALEPAGEFAGEYLGTGVATGEWDEKNAALEAFSSLGQSGATYAGQKAYQALTKPLQSKPDQIQPLPTPENPAPAPVDRPDPNAGALSRAASLLPAAGPSIMERARASATAPAGPAQQPAYEAPAGTMDWAERQAALEGELLDPVTGQRRPAIERQGDTFDGELHDPQLLEGPRKSLADSRESGIAVDAQGNAKETRLPNTPPADYVQGGRDMDQQAFAGKQFSNPVQAKNAIQKAGAAATHEAVQVGPKQFEVRQIAGPIENQAVQPRAAKSETATTAIPKVGMSVRFGGETYPVDSIEDAQSKWRAFRDATGAGNSAIGNGVEVFGEDGQQVARISYNGRAWDNADNEIKPAIGAGAATQAQTKEPSQSVTNNPINVTDSPISESTEALPEILTRNKKFTLAKMAKAAGVKKGSPGYDQAMRRVEADYESQVDDALAVLPFEQFNTHPMNSESPESVNRQAWNAMREERGLSTDAKASPAPATAPKAAQTPKTKAKPKGARKTVNSDTDTLIQAIARLGGISMDYREDTIAEAKGNRMVPGVGALFSKNGTSLDDMAMQLNQYNYIPASEMANLDGVPWLQEAVRAEYDGRKTHYAIGGAAHEAEMLQREADNYAAQVEQAQDQGIEDDGWDSMEVVKSDLLDESDMLDLRSDEAKRFAQELDDIFEGRTNDQGGSTQEGNRGAAQAGGAQEGVNGEAGSGESAPVQYADAGGKDEDQAFTLETQSEEQLAAQAAEQKAREKAEADAQKKADGDKRKADNLAAIKAANVKASETFELGQSAEDNLSGQGGMFDSQPSLSELGSKPPSQATIKDAAPTVEPVKAEVFVKAPDGSLDFGEITPEMAKAAGRQAGKIRLQIGVQNADGTGYGLVHIEANHGKQIRNAGFESVESFVSEVARTFNQIRKADAGQLLVAVKGDRENVMFVQLQPAEDSDYYRINTAFPASRDYLNKREKKGGELLWGGSEPAPAVTGQQPLYAGNPEDKPGQDAPIAQGQNRDTTLAQGNDGQKAIIKDFGEKIGGARKDTSTTGKKKAAKETDSRPAWQRRYEVTQVVTSTVPGEVGRWVISDTRKLDWKKQPKRLRGNYATEEEAMQMLPVIAVAQKHRVLSVRDGDGTGFEIWRDVTDRKRVKVVDQVFPSREAGMEYMAKNAEAIIETSTTFGEADLPRPESTVRQGAERRTGPVKDSAFIESFGFRGVEFGNWNNQEERQQLLDDAYDGLMDLAEVMGIPPRAISLNGDLALAFGARGQGLSGARAHYEPGKVVINLTKLNGAGSLAHEWLHALDHYFARQDGKSSSAWTMDKDGTRGLKVSSNFQSDAASSGFLRNNSGVREVLRNAYTDLMKTMFSKGETYVEDTARVDEFVGRSRKELIDRLDEIRRDLAEQKDPTYWKRNNKPASAEQLAEFDTVAQLMRDGTALSTELRPTPGKSRSVLSSMRWTNDALEKMSEIYKAVRGRTGFNAETNGVLDRLRQTMSAYSSRLKMLADAQNGEEKVKKVPTQFAMDAKELDQGRGTDYWTTPHEMAARAFQGYVEDKVAERGGQSPFLNFGPENVGILTPWGWKRPFPAGEERKVINQAFDKLIDVIQTRETEGGNVALYRLNPEPSKGIPLFSAQGIAKKLSAKLGVQVEAVATEAGLPPKLQAQIKRDKASGRVAGVYFEGKSYIIASNLMDAKHAIETALHETIGHAGIKALLGDKLGAVMHGIYRDMPKAMQAELKSRYADKVAGLSEREAQIELAEEYVAHLAEHDPQHGVISKLVAMIRQFIRNTFGEQAAGKWTRNDIVQLLAEAKKAARNNNGPQGGSRYRQGAEQHAEPELAEVSDIDEAEFVASLKGPAVQSIAGAMYKARGTDSPFFKNWFGKSKMVKDGKPIGFYHRGHGTMDNFDDARLGSSTGTATASLGHFLSRTDVGNVDRYGPDVDRFFVKMEKPLVVTQDQFSAMGDWSVEKVKAYRKTLMQRGHDGMYVQGLGWPIVFEGKNIKGVRNAGTFDETDRTRYSQNKQKKTDTAAFKKWFYGSKVVDESGEPMVLYNGARPGNDIGAFEMPVGGHDGIYFTPDPEYAESFAVDLSGENGAAGAMYPVYLNIKNPFIVEAEDGSAEFENFVYRGLDIQELSEQGYDGAILKVHGFGIDQVIAFDPKQIKSAIGNNGDYDAGNPDIRYSLNATAGQRETLRKLGMLPKEADSLLQQIRDAGMTGFKARMNEWGVRAREGLFDGLDGIKRAEAELGITDVNKMGYVSARLATGLADVMHGIMHYAAPEWRDGIIQARANTKGVLDVLSELGSDLTPWLVWLGSKRAQLLKAQGRENNMSDADIAEGLAMGAGKEALFESAYREYAKINEAVLDLAEQGGLIDPAQRATWLTDYYVPFYRETEDSVFSGPRTSKGLSHQSAAIKALKGGDMPTNDLLENMLQGWTKRVDAAMKNKALMETVDNLKDSRFMTQEDMKWQRQVVQRAEIVKKIKGDRVALEFWAEQLGMDETANHLEVAHELNKLDDKGYEELWGRVAPTDPDVIRVQRDGKNEYYRVHDEALLRSVKHMEGSQFNDPVTKLGRAFKRVLTTGVTASPDFILRNFIRDAAHAWAINPDGFKFGRDSIKGLHAAFKEDQDYRDLMFAGASFQGGYVHATDPEASAQIIRRALEKKGMTRAQRNAYLGSLVTSPAKAKDMIMQGWQKYRELGDVVENSNRLSTYKASLAAGNSKRHAAFYSKDMMDYSMRGNFAAAVWFTDMVPFLNARMQGLYKLGRATKTEDGEWAKEFAKKAGYVALFSLMLAAANDDDERYQELPDWDKDMNWHFWFSEDQEQPFRIPKPFEIGLLAGTVPERMLHAALGSQDSSDLFRSVVHGVFETLAFNPVPQIVQPMREVQANRDFFRGSPIEDMSDEGKLPEARYDERTSAIGYGIGQVTGKLLDVSPKQVDHLIKGYTGTLGGYVLSLSNVVAEQFSDAERPAYTAGDVPVVKVVYQGDTVRSTRYQGEFYDALGETEQLYRTVKAYRQDGQGDKADEMAEANKDKLRHRQALGSARQQLGAIRKRMDAIHRDTGKSSEQKRKELDSLQHRANQVAERIAKQVKEDF